MSMTEWDCYRYCLNNDTFNESVCFDHQYVDCLLRPKTMVDEGPLVFVTVLITALIAVGVLGNVAVCVVIVKHPSMRTNTSRYLLSLAINDLLLLIFGAPSELWRYYKPYSYTWGIFLCKMTTFVMETATYCSPLTVVLFSLERYFAICHPIRSQTSRRRPSPILILCAIWTLSMVCATPFTWEINIVNDVTYPNTKRVLKEVQQCALSYNQRAGPGTDWMNTYLRVTSVIFFAIPMIVLMAVYVRIGITIWTRRFKNENGNIRSNLRTPCGTIRLLIAVVVSFFICWAPFHSQRIYNFKLNRVLSNQQYVAAGFFFYLSAVLNPILYSIISHKYRTAFKEVLFGDRKLSREQDRCMK